MARDYIKVDTGVNAATYAKQLVALSQAMGAALRNAQQLLAVMRHMYADGPPVNFDDLEAAFGIQAGKGQLVFDMVNGAVGAMTGTMQNDQAKNLGEQVGI